MARPDSRAVPFLGSFEPKTQRLVHTTSCVLRDVSRARVQVRRWSLAAWRTALSIEDTDLAPDQGVAQFGESRAKAVPTPKSMKSQTDILEPGAQTEIRVARRILGTEHGGGIGTILERPAIDSRAADQRHIGQHLPRQVVQTEMIMEDGPGVVAATWWPPWAACTTAWDGHFLTDSGRFQVMSLSEVDDEGATFRSCTTVRSTSSPGER